MSLATGNSGIALVCAVVGGVIGAALCLWLFFLGIFLLGASTGAIVATALFNAAGNQPQPILVLVLAIVFGVIVLVMQKLTIIVCTAFSGSYLTTAGLLHLLAGVQNVSPLWIDHLQFGSAGILGYVALVFWLVLGLAGVSFQYRGRRRREEATRHEAPPA
jgi:TRAP-type C4-dicarboxylate transport system permease small subunit